MTYRKNFLVFLIACFLNLFIFTNVFSADIYVDRTLSSNCTSGNYSITNRNCNGSDGNAYRTIQGSINSMSGGDNIYMRSGTYQEGSILIPSGSKNGSPSNRSTLQSYPGEWAVIDGNWNCPNNGMCLGNSNSGSTASYWTFQKFEVKNCRSGTISRGIRVGGTGIKFRHLYIHDCRCTESSCSDNASGIYGNNPGINNSTIEFCYFYNNGASGGGSTHNCADIALLGDYENCYDSPTDGLHQNEIRYNLFNGTYTGFKHKGPQRLNNLNNVSLTNKNYGDDIHHNIFLNATEPIDLRADFTQLHHNIIDGDNDSTIFTNEYGSGCKMTTYMTIYNNTLIDCAIHESVGYGGSYCGISYPISSYHPYWYGYNNIITNYTNKWNRTSITLGRVGTDGGTLNISDLGIDRNLIYKPGSSTHINVSKNAGSYSGWKSVSGFNSLYATSNFLSSANCLFQGTSGANKYRIVESFSLGSYTVGNGGIGGAHPYLDGVTLPSYIGAVNPNDNTWVEGVLGLDNTEVLRNGSGGDPNWVEGGEGVAIMITSPSDPYELENNTTVNLSGSASDETSRVTWSCNRGSPGSGIASGTTNWSFSVSYPDSPDHNYFCGDNDIITVTAEDAGGGDLDTDTIIIDVRPCIPDGLDIIP